MDLTVSKLEEASAWLDWRGNYSFGFTGRGKRLANTIEKVIIHHTVTERTGDAKKDIDTLYDIHVKKNGWKGIGYNLVITSEVVLYQGEEYAKVAYVGDLETIRAHCVNGKGIEGFTKNYGNYIFAGISIIGDHTKEMPLTAQYRSLFYLIKHIFEIDKRFPKVTDYYEDLRGHNWYDYTWCPGDFGKIRDSILNISNSNMSDNIQEGFSAESIQVQSAVEWMRSLTEKAKKTPLSANTAPIDIVTNVSKENLERRVNYGTFLVLLARYNYNLRSIMKGEYETLVKNEIEKLDLTDGTKKEVFKAITNALSVDDREQNLDIHVK